MNIIFVIFYFISRILRYILFIYFFIFIAYYKVHDIRMKYFVAYFFKIDKIIEPLGIFHYAITPKYQNSPFSTLSRISPLQ